MKNEDCRMSNFQTTEEEYRQYAKFNFFRIIDIVSFK